MNWPGKDVWHSALSPPCACAPAPEPPLKLVDVRRAAAIARAERGVVFTNGCFDLLHDGHLATLEAARQLGDLLIVAVNSDASVRAIKGAGRPIQCQHVRAAALAAVRSVGLVVLQSDITPHRLLFAIQPNALAKGATTSEIVGAEMIRSTGGRAVRLNYLVPGISTTEIIAGARLLGAEPICCAAASFNSAVGFGGRKQPPRPGSGSRSLLTVMKFADRSVRHNRWKCRRLLSPIPVDGYNLFWQPLLLLDGLVRPFASSKTGIAFD